MNKISKDQSTHHTHVSQALNAAREALTTAVEAFNTKRAEAFAEVTTAAEKLNTELNAARELRDEVVSDMEGYTSDRSEKWAESEAASAFADWQSAWEGLDLDDVEVDEPEDLEAPEVDAEAFDQAPTDKGMV